MAYLMIPYHLHSSCNIKWLHEKLCQSTWNLMSVKVLKIIFIGSLILLIVI
jgi:hypothetical protein